VYNPRKGIAYRCELGVGRVPEATLSVGKSQMDPQTRNHISSKFSGASILADAGAP
jgi:hypothetical protein